MILIGLTGNIASGKSEVAKMLADHGATVIDADVLAREAVEPDTQALKDIVKRWGQDVLSKDGSLDRAALRRIVFADQSELDALNRIVHPGVTRLRDREIARARERGDDLVVCVIPLLFERNLVEEFDAIVLVDSPRPLEPVSSLLIRSVRREIEVTERTPWRSLLVAQDDGHVRANGLARGMSRQSRVTRCVFDDVRVATQSSEPAVRLLHLYIGANARVQISAIEQRDGHDPAWLEAVHAREAVIRESIQIREQLVRITVQ
jgi:dephospho-CoA kinase